MPPTDAMSDAAALPERAHRFAALHERDGVFVMPNPWDPGTARFFELLGFEALATTGAGHAFSIGRRDGHTDPAELLDHVATIAGCTSLPVSADLEDGFGTSPDTVAATITAAAAGGLAGGSIEDRHYRDEHVGQLFSVDHAAERIRAAADAAHSHPVPFTLTARCECFLVGRPDLAETIARLQAYQEAGADVLYAPGLSTGEQIATVTAAVDRPVNVVMGLVPSPLSLADLGRLGVRRVSLGSTLSRVAFGAVERAARELLATGTFSFVDGAIPYPRLDAMLAEATA